MNVLVTGANGFVGRALCLSLLAGLHHMRLAVRKSECVIGSSLLEYVAVGEIDANTDWTAALSNIDAVVHLAARVHIMHENSDDALAAYRRVNTDATLRLAQAAADAGVKRFVYLSTIKVNGETTTDKPFSVTDLANPLDPYAVSKYEAEQGLREIERNTKLQVVVIRPPLVYGPGVRGNFLRLLKLVKARLPLPLKGVENKRSLVYLRNLTSAIRVCVEHANAAGKTFIVSDDQLIGTVDLIELMAMAMDKPDYLIPFPQSMLRGLAKIIGKSDEISRLADALVVDNSAIKKELNWAPPYSLSQGLADTVKWFQQTQR
jgi:nucleoside-diphosphate-sugar epimerase